MADRDKRELTGNMLVHDPLPYKMRIRVMMGEDMAPMTHDLELKAYSIHEAMLQGVVQLGGITPDDSRFKFEMIEPDGDGYARWKENRPVERHANPARHI